MRKGHAMGATCAAALLVSFHVQAQTPEQTPDTVTPAQATGSIFAPKGNIEEVVVTARRRPENLEKIPVAVTAISGAAIRTDRIKSALDLQNFVPSLSVAANLGSRDDNVFTIRGQSQPFGGADPGVQTYFAEVPFNGGGPGSEFDMENIQVLNGPQGTLFGRNTTGGAVLFEPRRPDLDSFGGYIDGSLGNYAMKEIQGAINFPVGQTLAIRVAGDFTERNGYTRDITTGQDLDNEDYGAFRVGVLWKPTAHFQNYAVFDDLSDHNHGTGAELTGVNTATVDNLATKELQPLLNRFPVLPLAPPFPTLTHCPPASEYGTYVTLFGPSAAVLGQTCGGLANFEQDMLGTLAQQQALGPRKTTSSIPLFYRHDTWNAIDIARYDFNDNFYIRNIFGYVVDKERPAFDYDGSDLPILDIPNSRTWESNSYQVTEEVQLGGKALDDSLNWIFGFYHELDRPNGYSEVERETFGGYPPASLTNPLAAFGDTEIDSLSNGGTSNAVYGSTTFDASRWLNGLSFTAGGRYTWDHKTANSLTCILSTANPLLTSCPYPLTNAAQFSPLQQSANFHAPTWTLAANYQVTDDTMVYATYRRGYKSGGFNSGAGAAATSFGEFKPEYLTDVEVGSKNNWTILGVPGRTNFDAYYGWYSDIQKNDIVGISYTGPVQEPENFVALTFNAAKATVKGLEFQSTFIPDDNFEVNVFYSYTDATYSKFALPSSISISELTGAQTLGSPLELAGDPFAYTPQNKFGITPRFHIPVDESLGEPYLSGTLYWQSKVWFTDLSSVETTCGAFSVTTAGAYTCLAPGGQPPEQKSYALLNLRFDWENFMGRPFDLSVFMDNVTNRTYKVGADALLNETGTSASIYGPPRMFGIELRYRFGEDAGSGGE
jgi:iron complex outermembrane recepter protein